MKQVIALLLASGAIGVAGAALADTAPPDSHGFLWAEPVPGREGQILRVSDDEGDEEGWLKPGAASDSSDDDESCDDEEQDGACPQTGAGNAAPAGSVAPPKNGLFTDGRAPQVKTN